MTSKQEIMLRLACAALQSGMELEEIYDSLLPQPDDGDYALYDIATLIVPEAFSETEDTEIHINDTKY